MAQKQNLDLKKLLPSTLKNETLSSLVSNLFNRFVSEERSVLINGRIGNNPNDEATVQALDLERELNALIPAIHFKSGSEEFAYTFIDLINALRVLNVDFSSIQQELQEKYFNLHFPISYDKFVNYSNYYWTAKAVQPQGKYPWNISNDAEYYTIARPKADSKIKLPVDLATTRPIKLRGADRDPETISLTFTSPTEFTITGNQVGSAPNARIIVNDSVNPLGPTTGALISDIAGEKTQITLYAPDISQPNSPGFGIDKGSPENDALIQFNIENGVAPFEVGDSFTIFIEYRTSTILISFNSGVFTGKGAIAGARSLLPFMFIDGVQISQGMRILVKDQINAAENGIYVVSQSKWVRSDDAELESHLEVGAKIYVNSGVVNAGQTFELTSKTGGGDASDPISAGLAFDVDATTTAPQTNAWQATNAWIHVDDISKFVSTYSADATKLVQATRPIIEYDADLQLNAFINDENQPDVVGTPYVQERSAPNQPPLFDLFRYDGTPARLASPIFFYVEDPNFEVDAVLNRRVKITADYDYVFAHGLKDAQERLLFYKKVNGDVEQLQTLWVPGVDGPTVASVRIPETAGAGVSYFQLSTSCDTQEWTLSFNDGAFDVRGERSGFVGRATPGSLFECDDFSIIIDPALYTDGSEIAFSVFNRVFPRYVKKVDDQVINYPGGLVGDALDGEIDGVWLTPVRMFQNFLRESRSEIAFGDLINHQRSIMKNQDGFTGSSFGNNNLRNIPFDPRFGGTIRDFDKNLPLLASMLIQSNLSPITIIDFAEQQYNVALSSIDQFISADLPSFLAQVSSVNVDAIDPQHPDVLKLLQYFEDQRRSDENLTKMFGDTTALVANWPATLPMLGLWPATFPDISFDLDLGITTIVHHDGHISPIISRDIDVDRELVRTVVKRSDGTESAGIFSNSAPALPYARQLWFKSSTSEVRIFDVDFDVQVPPVGFDGATWFDRSTGVLYEWDSVAASWQPSADPIEDRWIIFSIENVRNSLVLAVERKLYSSVHPSQQVKPYLANAEGSQYAEVELARFAQRLGYDIFAPDYDATNAFTWNYSQAIIPGLGDVPARWYDIYRKHFDIPGQSLPTPRPNVEPWKLLNLDEKPAGWDAAYLSTVEGTENIVAPVRVVVTTDLPSISGLKTIDGVSLVSGDRVLLVGQSLARFNGIYVVSTSAWARSSDVLVTGLTVGALEGFLNANTVWTITTPGAIVVNTTPVIVEQVRVWKRQMWDDIKAARPGLKLCVNVHTDAVIPPYVSTNEGASAEALLTSIPPGVSNSYVFGDNGPVETVWKRSLQYSYGLARSAFRLNPLSFISDTWGDTFVSAYDGGARLERNLSALQPASKFLMHGDKLNVLNSYSPSEVLDRFGSSVMTWTRAALVEFVVSHVEDDLTAFSVYVNGEPIPGVILEGDYDNPLTLASGDGSFEISNLVIDDLGIPYELGDTLVIQFNDDIVDVDSPDYVPPSEQNNEVGCEGCLPAVVSVIEQPTKQVAPNMSHIPTKVKRFKGVGQWFTNLLRFSFIDTDFSMASLAYRGWDLKLIHRIGALIRQDTLSVDTVQGVLPQTAYTLLLKKNSAVKDLWVTGLRVQLVAVGKTKLNPTGFFVPTEDASDWVFRVETYSEQNPEIEKFALNTEPGAPFQTFFAINKASTSLPWTRYTETAQIEKVVLPITIVGLQNTINFIFGYADYLASVGWQPYPEGEPITDQETGRNIDWQLEVEKLIDKVFKGISTGEGHILNPYIQTLVLRTERGIMAPFSSSAFIDSFSAQGAYDVNGALIPLENIYVVRTDEQAVTYSNTPIFSAHVFVDEYEHAIVMNTAFSDSRGAAKIFDPFLSARIDSAHLAYIRQEEADGRPTFDGFFLSGNGVKRNIVSTVDSMARYYDAGQTYLEPSSADHAVALLGFTRKDYFKQIRVNDSTQFNFWRGLIQAKGTNMTIDAFVNYQKFNDAQVDEYWAYKVAEFGDAREKTMPELKVSPRDASQKFTKLQFYSPIQPTDLLPLFTHIQSSDDSRWVSIDELNTTLKFEAQQISEEFVVLPSDEASPLTPVFFKLRNIYQFGDAAAPVIEGPAGCSIINPTTARVTAPGIYKVSGYTWLNATKFSPLKLIDYQDKVVVADIQLWHPAIGLHSQSALSVVNIIANEDPARYSYSTKTVNNPSYNTLKFWAKNEVGRVWWDTSNLGYIPYYDPTIFPNIDTRLQRWGAIAEWASVDLYEWIESSVHPSEYDALAEEQEGRSDIDARLKASGKVAFKKYYKRDRSVMIRPIAWSKAGVGNANAHPAFGPAEFTTVYASGNRLIADKGRCADINLINDRRFGGWKGGKPDGEVIINGDFEYFLGSENSLTNPVFVIDTVASGTISEIKLEPIQNNLFGSRIGKIRIRKKIAQEQQTILDSNDTPVVITTERVFIRLSDDTNFVEDVEISDWLSASADVDSELRLNFETFGLTLTIVRSSFGSSPITANDIADAVSSTESDIFIREGIRFDPVIPLTGTLFVNDDTDPEFFNTEFEWRTWEVPTQVELDDDLSDPFNQWKPYLGDFIPIQVTPDVVKEMKRDDNALTLITGEKINRFNASWSEWELLESKKFEVISSGTSNPRFILNEQVDANRTSVYVNGTQVNPAGYVISSKQTAAGIVQTTITLRSIPAGGLPVLLLYRGYVPNDQELSFDPDVSDNFSVQTQYKQDYQYTMIEQRDEAGNKVGAKYYFWVENKTVITPSKNMSLLQAKNELKNGPSLYCAFIRALNKDGVVAYDSCAISGLSKTVTKENAYKIRFVRNFTLRDDPEELSLKNVHAEWKLIRKGQSRKIPAALWQLITDAACAEDQSGNPLPSQARVDFDNRNGTRTRYGFKAGQIFADTELVKASILSSILNTKVTIKIAGTVITDFITSLNFDEKDEWFSTPESTRSTMDLIYSTARPAQVNEIFFNVLEDALSNNFEFSDIFKTSYITVLSSTRILAPNQQETRDEFY